MLLFCANGLSQIFAEREIFRGVSLEVQVGERVAVVGSNGVGKTTLLRIIAGLDRPAAGELHWDRKVTTGFLTQVPSFSPGVSVEEVLSRASSRVPGKEGLGETLSRFWFTDRRGSPVAELSGGEKTRLQLACLWLQRPELLLLDEPTNHPDTEQLAWLERFVRDYPGTVILVSHDRYFLDRTVQRVLELRPDGMTSYPGGYSDYRKAKQDRFRQELKAFFDQEKQAKKLEKAIREQEQWAARGHSESRQKARETGGRKEYFRAKAKKLDRRAKNTIKRLERMQEERVARPREEPAMHLSLNGGSRGGKRLLAVEGLEKAYGSKVLFRGTDFTLRPGEKAALVGRNGSGKTTLLRILLGLEPADGGTVWRSPALRPGYLEQELRGIGGDRTVLEEVSTATSDLRRARDLLADLQLTGEAVFQSCTSLSMGQRVRVALAKLLLGVHDLLLLDEPTNYLDLPSREKLEEALAGYPGALIVVSHDRYLLDRVCGTVWALEDEKVKTYQGRYSEYMEHRQGTAVKQPPETGRLEAEIRLAAVAGKLALLDRTRDQEEFTRLEREYWEIQRRLR